MSDERLQSVIKRLKDLCPHYRVGQAIINSMDLTDDIEKLFYMQDSVLLKKLEQHATYIEKLTGEDQ